MPPAWQDQRSYQHSSGTSFVARVTDGQCYVEISAADRDGYHPSNPEHAERLHAVLEPAGFQRVAGVAWSLKDEDVDARLSAAFGRAERHSIEVRDRARVLPLFAAPDPDAVALDFAVTWFHFRGPALRMALTRSDGRYRVTELRELYRYQDPPHPHAEAIRAAAGIDTNDASLDELQGWLGRLLAIPDDGELWQWSWATASWRYPDTEGGP